MGVFFGVAKISNIFWGGLELMRMVDAGPEPTYAEK